ncbi:MAG TPA: PAS domain S-box protein, partial [Smithellaceae bacterium]|nr:PAS domain S-box protein [Smithellaceae bacterium]
TYVNEKVCRLFGRGRDEIVGKDDSCFFSVNSLEEIKRSDCRVIEHGETVTREETDLTSSDKVPRTYWVVKLPLKDGQGNIYGLCGISTDITDLKRTEEALKRSESQLSSIIEFLPDATFVIDLEGKVIAWNRAIEQMTGVNKDTMLGQKDHACMIPFYGERRRHLMDLIDACDPDLEARYDYVQKRDHTLYARVFAPALYDGKGAYLFATAAPLFDNHGKRIGSIESIRDITDYRQAEEELREAHTRLDEIIEYLPDATLVIDAQGKVIAWNKAIEDMTGVRAAEMIGRGNYEYALPFYGERRPILIDLVLRPRAEIEKKYVNIERTDTVMDGEAYMPALRGGEVYLYGRASVLKDSKGNVVGAIESIHDITARRKAEEKYRSIFENAVMGIFHSTLEGRIISANPAFARILGYDSPEEVIHTITDMALQIYVDPRRRSEFLHLMDTQGTLQEQEVRFYKKDKSIVLVLITGRAVRDGAGKLLYYEGTMQDITERKRLESQLRQAQKMEAIGTLAGGIAHDFNNILASIMGYTEMGLREESLDKRRNYLHQVLQACERAKNLVNQILSFSRQQEQERKPLDIRVVLKEALSLLRATLPTTINMKQHVAAQESTVLADPTQIHQIIMNLCTNAAHA